MKRGCTQCGECLNVCPVFREFMREEYAPKAKRLLLEPLDKEYGDGNAPALPWDTVKKLAKLCAGCGRCKQACARKLSTADLLADARAAHPHWSQFLWEIWIRHMGPLWPTIGFAASLLPEAAVPDALKTSMAPAKALVNRQNIKPWARLKPGPDAAPDTSVPVVLFGGCTANRVRPQWLDKAKSLLERWGYTVLDGSAFGCCGATMHHAGQYKTMEAMRENNVAIWKRLGKPRVTAFCASCFHGLSEYPDNCFAEDEAAEWRKKLLPLSALLEKPESEALACKPGRYGYHQPCHWGTADKDMPFLKNALPGLAKGSGLCCGMGGILKMSNPDLSMQMADTCLKGFPEGVVHIVTGCSGCALQLASATDEAVAVCHWLDVVD